jgi:diguanylate cyclase (GGDEF)-like protein/PAS domain S-box-containing protein
VVPASSAFVSGETTSSRPFRLMFEQSPVPQALIPCCGSGVVANDAFARLFAMSPEALLATAPESLAVSSDRALIIADIARLRDGELSTLFAQRRFLRATGDVFDGRVVASMVRDTDGRAEYVFVTIEDVSAHVRAAEALARSEACARALIENSPDVIVVLYPDGKWKLNEQGVRLLGYESGVDLPDGMLSLVHPDDVPTAAAAAGEIVNGTRPASAPVELRLRAEDGTYRQFECVGQDLRADPYIGGVVITARDITARKLAEARLRAAEDRFMIAFEHAPLVLSILDLEGNLVDINPAGCATIGRTRAELIGRPADLHVHPDDRAWAIEATTRQLNGSTAPVEFRLINSTGDATPVLSRASLVEPSGTDEQPYVITLQVDITERKRLEAELEARAARDDLTGLYNRTSLHELLEHALHQRTSGQVAALFVDLDDFKRVNDGFGHDAGDHALAHVARRIRGNLREGDIAARVGGDEFVIACTVDDVADALRLGERLRLAIQNGFVYANQPIAITASIGIALAQPGDSTTTLLRRADTASYVAKRTGKDHSEVFTGEVLDALLPEAVAP